MRIVETDNHGSDYPNERFVNIPAMPLLHAQKVAKAINAAFCIDNSSPRYWKVVEDNYQLKPGFTP